MLFLLAIIYPKDLPVTTTLNMSYIIHIQCMCRSQLRDVVASLHAHSSVTPAERMKCIPVTSPSVDAHAHDPTIVQQQALNDKVSKPAADRTSRLQAADDRTSRPQAADDRTSRPQAADDRAAKPHKRYSNMSSKIVNDPNLCASLVVKYLSPAFAEGKIDSKVISIFDYHFYVK